MVEATHLDCTLLFDTTAPDFSSEEFLVRELRGVEALSTPYEFELQVQCFTEGGISPDGIKQLLDASSKVSYGPGGIYSAAGVLREIELLEMEQDAQHSLYRMVLVPRFWLSKLTRRSRVFNEMKLPDIFKQVLMEMELSEGDGFELRLQGDYSELEYVVQYQETDFDFLSRWMERVGIFYCFEQDGEQEKLVLIDSNADLVEAPDHPTVDYSSRADVSAVGSVHDFRRIDRRASANVHVREYNWRAPGSVVTGEADIGAGDGVGLIAYHGDHLKTDADCENMARLRAEGLQAETRIYTGRTVNADFAPGYRFSVTGAPMGELNAQCVLTRVEHTAMQESTSSGMGSYSNTFSAIPYDFPYRPPRNTAWPRIDGVMHAKIDAESVSSAAPIDDRGRYRVVLPYDIEGEYGGRATRWIRKAEPYSGPAYGMHFTLHVGAEVLLSHIGGDPDRPIIVGSVPNPSTGTPLTSDNATRSAIRTRSGILIDFEDDA